MALSLIEHKTVPLTQYKAEGDDTGAGSFSGYGSIFGNVDSYGDVVAKGAFKATLPDFLRAGFIADGHDWKTPIAIPTMAREDDTGLYIEANFHSTPQAQSVRAIASERVAAGMDVGLSIGYETISSEREETGGDDVRTLKELRLFEISIVTVPANPAATVTGVKAHLPYQEHGARLIDDLSAYLERTRDRDQLLQKQDRALSKAACETLSEIAEGIAELLAAPRTNDDQKAALLLQAEAEYERTRAIFRDLKIAI